MTRRIAPVLTCAHYCSDLDTSTMRGVLLLIRSGGPLSRTKPSRISVLLDDEEYGRFHAYCVSQGFKKSTLIARLIREHLDASRFQVQKTLPLAAPAGGAR